MNSNGLILHNFSHSGKFNSFTAALAFNAKVLEAANDLWCLFGIFTQVPTLSNQTISSIEVYWTPAILHNALPLLHTEQQ